MKSKVFVYKEKREDTETSTTEDVDFTKVRSSRGKELGWVKKLNGNCTVNEIR